MYNFINSFCLYIYLYNRKGLKTMGYKNIYISSPDARNHCPLRKRLGKQVDGQYFRVYF